MFTKICLSMSVLVFFYAHNTCCYSGEAQSTRYLSKTIQELAYNAERDALRFDDGGERARRACEIGRDLKDQVILKNGLINKNYDVRIYCLSLIANADHALSSLILAAVFSESTAWNIERTGEARTCQSVFHKKIVVFVESLLNEKLSVDDLEDSNRRITLRDKIVQKYLLNGSKSN